MARVAAERRSSGRGARSLENSVGIGIFGATFPEEDVDKATVDISGEDGGWNPRSIGEIGGDVEER